jgi:hypothetical protein
VRRGDQRLARGSTGRARGVVAARRRAGGGVSIAPTGSAGSSLSGWRRGRARALEPCRPGRIGDSRSRNATDHRGGSRR